MDHRRATVPAGALDTCRAAISLVFQSGFVDFQEGDAWYHVRVAENLVRHFPFRIGVDPYLTYGRVQPIATSRTAVSCVPQETFERFRPVFVSNMSAIGFGNAGRRAVQVYEFTDAGR
jgi:hypothetical protein